MNLFVGSTNPVKINAAIVAASETWPEVETAGYEVDSGVSEQPRSDEETKQGAINRAQAVLKKGLQELGPAGECLGVGLEGGVFIDADKEMWTTVWAVVVDRHNHMFMSNGARFPVPAIVAKEIKEGGEMGPIMAQFFSGRSVKKQEGMIGVVTQKFIDRTEEYSAVLKMALGQWYGRNWQEAISA